MMEFETCAILIVMLEVWLHFAKSGSMNGCGQWHWAACFQSDFRKIASHEAWKETKAIKANKKPACESPSTHLIWKRTKNVMTSHAHVTLKPLRKDWHVWHTPVCFQFLLNCCWARRLWKFHSSKPNRDDSWTLEKMHQEFKNNCCRCSWQWPN